MGYLILSWFSRCVTFFIGGKMKRLKRGHSRKGRKTKTYVTWEHMRQHCNNSNDKDYKYYGGRGITVCERWNNFENFLTDMGECPDGLVMDRINNNGNYELSNCRWTDWKTSGRNRRASKLSKEKVKEIKELYSKGYKQREIAKLFDITQQHVSYVVNGNIHQNKELIQE